MMVQADSPVAWAFLLVLAIVWGIDKLRELKAMDEQKERELNDARDEWEVMFH